MKSNIAGFIADKNIRWILLSTVIITGCQFILYRYILTRFGIEQVGVWSLLIALTAVGQVSNFGFSSGLIKYIPTLKLQGDSKGIHQLVGTANGVNLLFSIPFLALIYFPVTLVAKNILPAEQLSIFSNCLPWTIFAILLNNMATVYAGLMDGHQFFHTRTMIQSAGYLVLVISGTLLGAYFGLKGITIALLGQSFFLLTASAWIAVKKGIIPGYFPLKPDKDSFRKLFAFGMKFQLMSILSMIFDPLTKYFITSKFGIGITGIFEIANKTVIQLRNLLVNTNQVIAPKVAESESDPDLYNLITGFFEKNLLLSVMAMLLLLPLSPVMVKLFTGNTEQVYIDAMLIAAAGWFVNMAAAPLYYSSAGLGKLKQLIRVHFLQVGIILLALLTPAGVKLPFAFIIPAMAIALPSILLIAEYRKMLDMTQWKIIAISMIYLLINFCVCFLIPCVLKINYVLPFNLFIFLINSLLAGTLLFKKSGTLLHKKSSHENNK